MNPCIVMLFPGGYSFALIHKEPQRGIKREEPPGLEQYLQSPEGRVLVSVQGEEFRVGRVLEVQFDGLVRYEFVLGGYL